MSTLLWVSSAGLQLLVLSQPLGNPLQILQVNAAGTDVQWVNAAGVTVGLPISVPEGQLIFLDSSAGNAPITSLDASGNLILSAKINASTQVKPGGGSAILSLGGLSGDFIAPGTIPASTGILRLPSATAIKSRNAANNADIALLATDASNNVQIGSVNAASVQHIVGPATVLQQSLGPTDYASFGSPTAASGSLRGANNVLLFAARNAANSADVTLLQVDASNNALFGGANAASIRGLVGATTVLQFGQLATDFAAFGVSPGTSGFIRSPLNSTIIGANSTTVLGIDSTGVVQLNAITGKSVNLAVNGVNELGVDGNNILINGTNNLFFTAVAGGAYSVGFGNTATSTAATITLVGQNAGGAGPTAGGAAGLVSGLPAGAGAIGQITLFFGGVASTNQIVFQGATSAAGLGTQQWSNAITPVLTQLALASTSGGNGAAGIVFTVQSQAGQAATGVGNNGGAGAKLLLLSGAGGTSGSATAGTAGSVQLGVGGVEAFRVEATATGVQSAGQFGTSLIGGAGSYGGGQGVAFLGNAGTNPNASPTAGAVFYSSGGQSLVRNAGDTQGLKLGTTQAVRKPSDQSVTSSIVLVNETAMTVAMGASDTYIVTWTLFVAFVSASGIQVSVTVPTGATGGFEASLIVGGTPAFGTAAFATGVNLTTASAVTQGQVILQATVVGDGTHSGTITLQFSQTGSSSTATTVKANSGMVAVKV